jgi:hypothetical protein
MTAFKYSRLRGGLYALLYLLVLLPIGLWFVIRGMGLEFLGGVVITLFALIAFFQTVARLFTSKPAIGVDHEGLRAQRLGGRLIPWNEIEGVQLRHTKRKALGFIPMNTVELALTIHPDKPFWKSGGIGRTLMRWLSRASDNHFVLVNLNGLAGGKPERVIDAIRTLRPDLVQDADIREEKPD